MSNLYDEFHSELQDQQQVGTLANIIEQAVYRESIEPHVKTFIESRDMFFLSTIDQQGRPTVSYKGGAPGFVKVVDENTLAFPSFDGNAMYLSMGNINGNKNVGLLFIDFENPHRLRVQGEASIQKDDPLLTEYTEAEMIVRINVTHLFRNCPRYVHQYKKVEDSKFVPQKDVETPMPDWIRIDVLQSSLPEKDRIKTEKYGGTITIAEMEAMEERED